MSPLYNPYPKDNNTQSSGILHVKGLVEIPSANVRYYYYYCSNNGILEEIMEQSSGLRKFIHFSK